MSKPTPHAPRCRRRSDRLRPPALLAFVALPLSASLARADVVFTSATRQVSASADSHHQSDAFAGFGQYDHSVSAASQACFEPPGIMDDGYADQSSFIGMDQLTFAGYVYGHDNTSDCAGSGSGGGSSQLTLAFSVVNGTRWTFDSHTSGGYSPVSGWGFDIRDASNSVVSHDGDVYGYDKADSGALASGNYTLRMSVSNGGAGTYVSGGSFTFNWAFTFSPALISCCKSGGACVDLTINDCAAQGGSAGPEGSTCSNPCAFACQDFAILGQPAGTTACGAAASAQFGTAAGGGASPLTYLWQVEAHPTGSGDWIDLTDGPLPYFPTGSSANASGTDTDTLTISDVDDAAAARYRCTVTDACGRTDTTNPAVLKVCRVDFNCDGRVTLQDLFSFLGAWFQRLPETDYDHSGSATVEDLFEYLAMWFAGCA